MKNIILLMLFGLLAFSACVPTSKYREAQQATKDNQKKIEERDVTIAELNEQIEELKNQIATLKKQNDALAQDTALASITNRTLHNRLSVLENDLKALATKMGDVPEYRSLMNHLNQMQDELANSNDKLVDSEKNLEAQKQMLADANSALSESEAQLAASNAELANKSQQIQDQQMVIASAQRDLEAQAAKLAELEALLAAKDEALVALKNKIANALSGFHSDELTVEHKNGRVYVSLEEKLLFASGQYDVNSNGATAITKIAGVLSGVDDDIDITVEGHTDNIPLKGTVILDNWDLSVKRATSVVRILISGGLASTKVQAVGRADTMPVATNDTAEGRCKNRRTEIILTPNVDSILKNL